MAPRKSQDASQHSLGDDFATSVSSKSLSRQNDETIKKWRNGRLFPRIPTGGRLAAKHIERETEREGANADEISPKANTPKDRQLIESVAGLIDKYVLSSDRIPFLAVLAVMGYIFLQDNAAGRLESWNDIFWTLQKCSVLVALYLFLVLSRYACLIGKKLIDHFL